ncbi:hypothetical protein L1987_89116 [Smallanthus sonchifolius]|nr:hypothetical protein L1987_89116 [Smallanthus sonchifolius]
MSEDDLPFLERTMLRHWVLQWLKLVSWYYTVLASDYVTIEEALSGPVVATDWRAQKDVNSALLNGRDGVMFCTGTLTSIVSGYTLVQQAGVTQPTAVLFRSFNVATSEKDPSLSWLEKMEDVEEEKTAGGRFLFIKGPCIARGNRKCAPAHQLKKGGILPYSYEKGKGFQTYLPNKKKGASQNLVLTSCWIEVGHSPSARQHILAMWRKRLIQRDRKCVKERNCAP